MKSRPLIIMIRYFILLSCILATIGCSDKKRSRHEVVKSYYDALNASDWTKLIPLLADTITIAEGDYISSYSREDFKQYFRWDSVFQTSYKIIELDKQHNDIIAKIALSSKRFEFLKNNPLTCKFRISLNADKITKLETIAYLDADWDAWENQRDSLVNWTNINRPELDGFINDLTMKGALNYMRAIELYTNGKDFQ